MCQVDSYGQCLKNRPLPNKRLEDTSTATTEDPEFMAFTSRYKFHLAMENAICADYMTEKLWRPMYLGAVPIYRGSPSVKDWMPNNHSVILIDDFASPKDLADFILSLDRNDDDYLRYLEYKNHGQTINKFLIESIEKREWGVNDMTAPNYLNGFECFVCDQENARIRAEKRHGKGKGPAPAKHIAAYNHMGCPMPVPGLGSAEKLPEDDRYCYFILTSADINICSENLHILKAEPRENIIFYHLLCTSKLPVCVPWCAILANTVNFSQP